MRKVLTCNRFPLDKVACLCLLSFFPKRKELKIVRIQVERRKEGRIKSKKDGESNRFCSGFYAIIILGLILIMIVIS